MGESREICFGKFLKPRTKTYASDASEVLGLQRISKISFEGELVTGGRKLTKTNQIIVHPKDVVFSGLNIEKGAICINETGHHLAVSTNYNSLEVDYKVVDISFLKFLLSSPYFRNILIDNLPRNYSFTRPKKLLPIKIKIPDIDSQKHIARYLHKMVDGVSEHDSEILYQYEYISKLRQAVLQEAIEGKLTAEWRKQNPRLISGENHASKLLEKIRAEKDRLIKEGKIRKDKSLPAITNDEKPHGLPDGWVWCRLSDVSLNIHYGFNASAIPQKKDVRLLRITDIQNNKVDWDSVPGCHCSEKDVKTYGLSDNDIVIARTGGTIGKSFLIKNTPVKSIFASYLIRVIPSKDVGSDYLKRFLESPEYWKQLHDAAWGAGQPNVNGTSLSKLVLPLPYISEQRAIVERIDKLMAVIDELEKQVIDRKEQSELLMQSVLREAFEYSHA